MTQIIRSYLSLGLTIVHFFIAQAYREHKVHNIVLYPDKHSWCKTTTIKQVISYPGCAPVEIDNNVCVGACFSYSIPHTEPSNPGEVIVPYCDSCQPSKTQWHQITLQCEKNTDDDTDTPLQLTKHVQIIQNCSCIPCEKDSLRLEKFPESNEEQFLQQSVDTEFLNALQKRNESSNTTNSENGNLKKVQSLSNQKLPDLFKLIQANMNDEENKQLIDIMNFTHESLQHQKSTKNIVGLINSLWDNKTDLNISYLTNLLLKFENLKHHNKENSNFDERNQLSDEKSQELFDIHDERTIKKLKESILAQDYSSTALPVATWVKSPHEFEKHNEDSFELSEQSKEHSRWPNSTHADGEKHINTENKSSDKHFTPVEYGSQNSDTENQKQAANEHMTNKEAPYHQHPSQHQHQHHVNENIIAHGHLAKGPHGALVIEPDRIHEKFDVNVHELKPNHAGTLLSYHSHSDQHNLHE